MENLLSIGGEHFQMEDGSYLIVLTKNRQAEQLLQSMTDGDIAFSLSRNMDRLIGLLRPAGEQVIDAEIIRHAASVIAVQLRKKRLVYDDKHERSYRFLFRILPCSFHLSISVTPASRQYLETRSLRPSARRRVALALTGEIQSSIQKGDIQRALEKSEQVHFLQPRYRKTIVDGILKRFVELGKEISENERFYLPRLLAAHKSYRAVLNELKPYLQPDALPSPRTKAVLASIKGDYGQGKDVVADVLVATGHIVKDVGYDLEPAEILDAVRKERPELLVITALVPVSLRVATDLSTEGRISKRAVKDLVKLLKQQGLHDSVEIILVGFAFDKRFPKTVGIKILCRSLWSLFQEFYKRSTAKQRK